MTDHRLPDDLDQFERQLRSLMPRKAACQLDSDSLSAADNAKVKESVVKESVWVAAAKRPAWAAALLLSWSLGAAVGTSVTLLLVSQRDGSDSQSHSLAAITQEATSANGEHSPNMPHQQDSQRVSNDLPSESPTETLPETRPERNGKGNALLTAYPRDIDTWLLELQFPGYSLQHPTNSHGQPAEGAKKQESLTKPTVPIVPARMVAAPPVRQQDLLRDLLGSSGMRFK